MDETLAGPPEPKLPPTVESHHGHGQGDSGGCVLFSTPPAPRPPQGGSLQALAHREAVFIFQPLNLLLLVPCPPNPAGTFSFRPSARPPLGGSASKVLTVGLSGRSLPAPVAFSCFSSHPQGLAPPSHALGPAPGDICLPAQCGPRDLPGYQHRCLLRAPCPACWPSRPRRSWCLPPSPQAPGLQA